MLIKNVKICNHEILGNIEFDFTDKLGKIVNTAIIAGENATGKSTFLNLLHDLIGFQPPNHPSAFTLTITIQLDQMELIMLDHSADDKRIGNFLDGISNNEVTIKFDYAYTEWNQFVELEYQDINKKLRTESNGWLIRENRYLFRSIFSQVEINFNSEIITNVTSSNIDNQLEYSIKSDSNLATQITQLLIDIRALDSEEIHTWVQENPGAAVPNEIVDKRIKRFTEAFHYMFPTKRFKGIQNINGEKKIIFSENGIEIPIEKLSSGEKQIVFRGSFLLKDKNNINGALILVDEPEISMHPEWQLKILDFFKMILSDPEGIQTSQLFVVTHSPFIIHNVNRNDDKVIVLKRGNDGKIFIPETTKFYGWSNKQVVKEAFNINYNLTNDMPVVFVEGETDEMYFKDIIKTFGENINVEFKWVGRLNEQGKAEFTGESSLTHTKNMLLANPNFIKEKVILLYDPECKKPTENFNKLHVRTMPLNKENGDISAGIENLLSLPECYHRDKFYVKKETKKSDGSINNIESFRKMDLCKFIISLDNEIKKDVYKNFKPILDEIKALTK